MSAAEFLAWNAGQTVKHEFVHHEVFAMAGAGEAHVTTTLIVSMALRQHLKGSPCRTFVPDMKLRVEAADTADLQVKREPPVARPGAETGFGGA